MAKENKKREVVDTVKVPKLPEVKVPTLSKIERRGAYVNLTREWVKMFIGLFLMIFGMAIVVYSLVMPPLGVIDGSVITVFGLVIGYMGSMFGIDSHAKIKQGEQEAAFRIKELEFDEKMRLLDRRLGLENDKEDVED